MRARRRDPAGAGVSHRLAAPGAVPRRHHDRVSIAVHRPGRRDGEMRETRRAAGHRAMSPNGSDDAMGTFQVPRASRAAEPTPGLGAWDVPLHWGAHGALGLGRHAGRAPGGGAAAGQRAVCLAAHPPPHLSKSWVLVFPTTAIQITQKRGEVQQPATSSHTPGATSAARPRPRPTAYGHGLLRPDGLLRGLTKYQQPTSNKPSPGPRSAVAGGAGGGSGSGSGSGCQCQCQAPGRITGITDCISSRAFSPWPIYYKACSAAKQNIASGERCESVAEKRSKQRTTAYTRLLAHAKDA
jgi:hypothetical protein